LEMQKEMIADIEAARPEFVVFVNVPLSVGRLAASETLIFSWANAYLHSQYEKIGTVDMNEPTEYVWGEAANAYQPRSRSFIDVFRRKRECRLMLPVVFRDVGAMVRCSALGKQRCCFTLGKECTIAVAPAAHRSTGRRQLGDCVGTALGKQSSDLGNGE
jgi:hypothetical protein